LKRIISIFMTLVMVLGMIPADVFTAYAVSDIPAEDKQIISAGGQSSDSGVAGGYNDVFVSKTITEYKSGSDYKENYFDITLKITSPQHIQEYTNAVVLVVDISNTMNHNHNGVTPTGSDTSRIQDARAAALEFVDNYVHCDHITSDVHELGIVTFNTNAKTHLPLTAATVANGEVTNLNTFTNSINALKADDDNNTGTDYNASHNRFTNIEGGLKLAQNLLSKSSAKNKNIILLTDGFPTTYIQSGSDSLTEIKGYDPYETDSYSKSKLNQDGFFYDTEYSGGVPATHGTSYSDKAAQKAQDMAAAIKGAGINIFTIGVDVDQQTVWGYDYNNTAKYPSADGTFSVIDRRSNKYVIYGGQTEGSYVAWLQNTISNKPAFYRNANSKSELTSAFSQILSGIRTSATPAASDGVVIDPMGENIEFLGFYSAKDNFASFLPYSSGDQVLTGDSTGQVGTNIENTVTYTASDETIKWIPTSSPWIKETAGGKTVYSMMLKYRVRLENENAGFTFGVTTAGDKTGETPANKTTTFEFFNKKTEKTETVEFPIPSVKGYKGEFSFAKTDDSRTPIGLNGAEWTLIHDAGNCAVCEGDAVIADIKVTSANDATYGDGYVKFADIPSGHTYKLKETKAPDGYKLDQNTYSVVVSYSDTTTTLPVAAGSTLPAVVNKPFDKTVKLALNVGKIFDGAAATTAGSFEFTLTGNGVNQTKANDANGKVAFDSILLGGAGEYTFTVKEAVDASKVNTVVFDGKEYEIRVVVDTAADGQSLAIKSIEQRVKDAANWTPVTVPSYTLTENDTVMLYTADTGITFANNTRNNNSVEFVLKATKKFNGTAVDPDAKFTFGLYNAPGQITGSLIETKEIKAGQTVDFTTVTIDNLTGGEELYYFIKEIDGGNDDIVYDLGEHKVKVTIAPDPVTDKYTATVVYETSGDNETEGAVITNSRVIDDVDAVITANKSFIDSDGTTPVALTGGEFEFRLDGVAGTNTAGYTATVTNAADGTVTFPAINYTQSGVYEYDLHEINGIDDHINYSKKHYKVTVTVAKDTSNEYTASVTYLEKDNSSAYPTGTAPTFVNTKHIPAEVQFHAVKNFLNHDSTEINQNAGDFTFRLEAGLNELGTKDTKAEDIIKAHTGGETFITVTSDGEGFVSFPSFEFLDSCGKDESHNHYFWITETAMKDKLGGTVDKADVIKDDRTWVVVVKVTKSATTPTVWSATDEYFYLDGTNWVKNEDALGNALEYAEFTNIVRTPDSTELTAVKELYDLNNSKVAAIPADTFEFELYKTDDTFATAGLTPVSTMKVPADGTVIFNTASLTTAGKTELTFSDEGNFYYVVKEKAGTQTDYLYDSGEIQYTVTVGINASGNYVVTGVAYKKADGTAVVNGNNKIVNRTRKPVSTELTVNKELYDANGGKVTTIPADTFEFELYKTDDTFATAGLTPVSTMKVPADGTVTFNTAALTTAGKTELTFSDVDKFYYVIKEKAGTDTTYLYDTKEIRAVVDVVAEGDSYKVNSVNYTDTDTTSGNDNTFVNNTRKPAQVILNATKTIQGRTPNAGRFGFSLYKDAVAPANKVEYILNDSNGEVKFTPVEFNKHADLGEHVYYIKEESTTPNGTVVYDKTVYKAVVTVTAGTDKYETEVEYFEVTDSGDVKADEGAKFENMYRRPVRIELKAEKLLNDTASQPLTLTEDQFEFTLIAETSGDDAFGPTDTKLATVGNAADGTVLFDIFSINRPEATGQSWLVFAQPADVTYYIVETPTDGTYIYDETVWTVKVSVTPDTADSYVADIKYYRGTSATAESIASFTNTLRKPVSEGIRVNKVLKDIDGNAVTADKWPVKFTFTLAADNDLAKEILSAEQTLTTATGVDYVEFGDFTFEKAGTYRFTVTEKGHDTGDKADDAVIFDKVTHTVEFVVEAGTGTAANELVIASVKIDGTTRTAPEVTVENKLREPAKFTPVAWKTLDRNEVKSGRFTFELLDKDGNLIQRVTNGEKGKVSFDTLKFNEVGEYVYRIVETDKSESQINYDSSEFTLTINVSVDEDDDKGFAVTHKYDDSKGNDFKESSPLFKNKTKKTTKDVPDTGDNTGTMLYAGLLAASAIAVTALVIIKKKEHEE